MVKIRNLGPSEKQEQSNNVNIEPGTRLGRYEIRSLIAEGGMGQVYRAKDPGLGRDVAIKILPPDLTTSAGRLERFEQEARAASALNHPNILAIYDVGTHDNAPYVVSELLEGETLRDRLRINSLPLRKSVDYALQIARGLAAAHARGIVHRDVKPENLFITKDGHVKILDFGLAKLTNPLGDSGVENEADTVRLHTHPGVVLGTAGYMSPEQVRGQPADHRCDIFSFGAVFYEMLTRERAFRGDSSVEAMSAILKEEPPALAVSDRRIPPPLERVIRHCLEKRPEDRFQSTRDLVFDLEAMSGVSDLNSRTLPSLVVAPTSTRNRLRVKPWLLGALVVAVTGASFFMGRNTAKVPLPAYSQLTFRRGTIYSARFARDSHTILFSAAWNGNAIDIYSMRSEALGLQALGTPNTRVLAVSSKGEMAVLLNNRHLFHATSQGTLARMPLGGGAARELLENVQEADWAPDGERLAVVRFDENHNQLEYPIGKVLYQTGGYISNLRVSPNGDLVAFLDHPLHGDNRGSVVVVDSGGKLTKLSGEWSGEEGLAWSGNEIWFTATRAGEAQALYAVTVSGKERVVARAPTSLRLHDIANDGSVLLSGENESTPIAGLAPGESKERDFSWLNWVRINDLSHDGKTFVFSEFGQGSGSNYAVYLRKTDGTEAIRLGDGFGFGMSPDGKWVISIFFSPPQIVLLPTGAGQAKPLERFGIEQYGYGAAWLPDGKTIVFIGKEPGHPQRSYVQNIDSGPPRPVTPEGLTGTLVSPDGKMLLGRDREDKKAFRLFPLDGSESRSIPGLADDDRVICWGFDRDSIYIYRPRELPLKLFKLNVMTGRKELWKEITPADQAGIRGPINVLVTPDGKAYLYAFTRSLSDLFLVTGLR